MDVIGIILIALIIVLTLAVICTLVGFDVVEYFRRMKHPKWYEHFDRATKYSFSIGGRLKDKTTAINRFISTQQEALRDGKWTDEDYRTLMRCCADEYIKAVNQYRDDFEKLGIEADLKAADTYAKEHNWKWGILYDEETGQEPKGDSISS